MGLRNDQASTPSGTPANISLYCLAGRNGAVKFPLCRQVHCLTLLVVRNGTPPTAVIRNWIAAMPEVFRHSKSVCSSRIPDLVAVPHCHPSAIVLSLYCNRGQVRLL